MFDNVSSSAASVRLDFAKTQLYGRDEEIQTLREAFERVSLSRKCEIVWLSGYSGSGKSRLADTLRDVVPRGYLLKGKYDELLRSPHPFSAIADAFSTIPGTLGRHESIEAIRQELETAPCVNNLVYMSKIVTNLANLWGDESKTRLLFHEKEKVDHIWMFERIKIAMRDFIRVLSRHSITIALVLDDLQWADSSSLELIQSILNDDMMEGLLFVGAYRDNEVDDSHPLAIRLRNIRNSSGFGIQEIHVASLGIETLNMLVADVTKSKPSRTMELTKAVHQKTLGNAFFAVQFLKMLQDDELLFWSNTSTKWDWDLDAIMGDTTISDNVSDIVARKISQLSSWTAEILMVAACFGTYFHFDVVVAIVEKDPKFSHDKDNVKDNLRRGLDCALSEGLVTHREGSSKYMFVHDKVHQGAYSLIPEDDKLKLHLRIGYFLKDTYQATESSGEWMFLVFTDQLNRGSTHIYKEEQRVELARDNLEAALKVMSHSAFFPAARYLKAGLNLMEGTDQWNRHYDLTVKLHSVLADVAYCTGDTETCTSSCNQVLKNARDGREKRQVYLVMINSWGAQGKLNEAIDFGLNILRELGEPIPERPNLLHALFALRKVKKCLKDKTDEDILSIPPMQDETKLFVLDVISLLSPICYLQHRDLEHKLLCLRTVLIAMEYGLSSHAARAISLIGYLNGRYFDFDQAYRYGRLSGELAQRFPDKASESRTFLVQACYLLHLRRPLHEQLDRLLKANQYGMDSGDIQQAGRTAGCYAHIYLFCGLPLGPMVEDAEAFAKQLVKYKQTSSLPLLNTVRQEALNLMGRSSHRVKLTGAAMNQDDYLSDPNLSSNQDKLYFLWIALLQTAFYFEDYDVVEDTCYKLYKTEAKMEGTMYLKPSVTMFMALSAMKIGAMKGKGVFLRIARKQVKELETWVKNKALNVKHKLLLVYAEREAQNKNHNEIAVRTLFGEAISSARKSGFTQDAALASELAGRYSMKLSDMESAKQYYEMAIEFYTLWGADAKVDQLIEQNHFIEDARTESSQFFNVRGKSRFSNDTSSRHERFDPFRYGQRQPVFGFRSTRNDTRLPIPTYLQATMNLSDHDVVNMENSKSSLPQGSQLLGSDDSESPL